MVARGRLTSLCFVDSALISFADRHPKVCLSFVLELSFRVQISSYPINQKSHHKGDFSVLLVAGEGFDFALLCRTGIHSLRSPAFCRPPFVCSEPTFSSVQLLATHINQKSHHKGDFSVLLVVQRS